LFLEDDGVLVLALQVGRQVLVFDKLRLLFVHLIVIINTI
jgi:hypothetical protein